MAPLVRLLSGEPLPGDLLEGACSVGEARGRVGERLGVPSSRVELCDPVGLRRLDLTVPWDELPADLELVALVAPPHALPVPPGRLEAAEGSARRPAGVAGGVLDLGDIGAEPPLTPFLVAPLFAMAGLPESLHGRLSKAARVGALRRLLARELEVPVEAVGLSFDGSPLDDEGTLAENGVPEPGPLARRNGAKVHLALSLPDRVLPGHLSRAVADQVLRVGEAEWQRFVARFVDGPEQAVVVQVPAAAAGAGAPGRPPWWSEWPAPGCSQRFAASDEVKAALQTLVDAARFIPPPRPPGFPLFAPARRRQLKVEAVIRNESRPLWERYCATRAGIQAAGIERRAARTSEFVAQRLRPYLGELREDLNEFVLFRGIEPSEAGCLHNAVEVPEAGLHFCDDSDDADMQGNWERIGDVHGRVHTMLLCRVLCGGIVDATWDSVQAVGWPQVRSRVSAAGSHRSVSYDGHGRKRPEIVVFDLAQVYPEYLLLYRPVEGPAGEPT